MLLLDLLTYLLLRTRSLNNFNQALNATTLFLDSLDRSVRLVTDSYQGQSKVLKTTIETIKVLQNPQAFSSAEKARKSSRRLL